MATISCIKTSSWTKRASKHEQDKKQRDLTIPPSRDSLTSLIPINKLPPPTPPYTGGALITKRFPLLCKEGLGEVVIKRLTCYTHPFFILKINRIYN